MHWLDICFDPSYLILGGGMVCKNHLLFKKIKQQYETITQNVNNHLLLANLGEKSGVYGAIAFMWFNMHGHFPTFANYQRFDFEKST